MVVTLHAAVVFRIKYKRLIFSSLFRKREKAMEGNEEEGQNDYYRKKRVMQIVVEVGQKPFCSVFTGVA